MVFVLGPVRVCVQISRFNSKKKNVTLDTNLVDHLKQKLAIMISLKLNRHLLKILDWIKKNVRGKEEEVSKLGDVFNNS